MRSFASDSAASPTATAAIRIAIAPRRFDVEGYLDYQGALFSARMDPQSYLVLTRAMDLFDTRDRVLAAPAPAMTFVGISSDWLFLPADVRAAAERFAREGADSVYLELQSNHGHDAFLGGAGSARRDPAAAPEGTLRLRRPSAARR